MFVKATAFVLLYLFTSISAGKITEIEKDGKRALLVKSVPNEWANATGNNHGSKKMATEFRDQPEENCLESIHKELTPKTQGRRTFMKVMCWKCQKMANLLRRKTGKQRSLFNGNLPSARRFLLGWKKYCDQCRVGGAHKQIEKYDREKLEEKHKKIKIESSSEKHFENEWKKFILQMKQKENKTEIISRDGDEQLLEGDKVLALQKLQIKHELQMDLYFKQIGKLLSQLGANKQIENDGGMKREEDKKEVERKKETLAVQKIKEALVKKVQHHWVLINIEWKKIRKAKEQEDVRRKKDEEKEIKNRKEKKMLLEVAKMKLNYEIKKNKECEHVKTLLEQLLKNLGTEKEKKEDDCNKGGRHGSEPKIELPENPFGANEWIDDKETEAEEVITEEKLKRLEAEWNEIYLDRENYEEIKKTVENEEMKNYEHGFNKKKEEDDKKGMITGKDHLEENITVKETEEKLTEAQKKRIEFLKQKARQKILQEMEEKLNSSRWSKRKPDDRKIIRTTRRMDNVPENDIEGSERAGKEVSHKNDWTPSSLHWLEDFRGGARKMSNFHFPKGFFEDKEYKIERKSRDLGKKVKNEDDEGSASRSNVTDTKKEGEEQKKQREYGSTPKISVERKKRNTTNKKNKLSNGSFRNGLKNEKRLVNVFVTIPGEEVDIGIDVSDQRKEPEDLQTKDK